MSTQQVSFPQVVQIGCGIDVHQSLIVATIRKSDSEHETRSFDAFTSSLKELREWCKSESVTQVAMESTGVYWKPVFNILEEDFEVLLVNARHVKNIPGHKTDKKDSIWLSKLLLGGLLKGSFIPPRNIRDLRDIVRYRKKQDQMVSAEKNRMYKILEDANVKLGTFIKADSVSGRKIINALIEGESNIDKLLSLVHGKVQADREQIRKSLEGHLTNHHRFMLKLIRESIETKEILILKIDQQIDEMVECYNEEIELLSTIDGVQRQSAITIISEIGTDMSRFPNEHHLSSLGGMSPGNNESAGKKKVQKPSKATNTSGRYSPNAPGGQHGKKTDS